MNNFHENEQVKLNLHKEPYLNLHKEPYNEYRYKETKQLHIDENLFEKTEKEVDEYIDPYMESFRKVIGGLFLVMFIFYMFLPMPNEVFKDGLTSGVIDNVAAGDLLSEEALKFDPVDCTIEVASSYGDLEIAIWNFASKEDNDYVQVFIDGVVSGAPFSVRNDSVKIKVPEESVIQVQGVRDGSNNGITYAMNINKTGKTYLNTVSLNEINNYTIIKK